MIINSLVSGVKIIIIILCLLELTSVVLWPVDHGFLLISNLGSVCWVEFCPELLKLVEVIFCD
jgi:hypothetical protein